jgi:hypothetical protein
MSVPEIFGLALTTILLILMLAGLIDLLVRLVRGDFKHKE